MKVSNNTFFVHSQDFRKNADIAEKGIIITIIVKDSKNNNFSIVASLNP